jgi:serine/threonine-protein kinase
VLGVGSRTDERPYYAEDRHLLGDLAVHASPILEQQLARGARRSQSSAPALVAIAGECASCGLVVAAEDAAACPQCAIPLERSSLPPVLNGKYRVRARIGRGGMGVVYRAEDELLGRTVALKTLPYLSGLGELRSTAEGRAMAGATHPNLAIVYGCELSIDRPVLVLEFLPGGTLNERLDRGPLSVGKSLRIVMSLCDGLGWLHRQGLSHGDIKPTNIGFSASGEPKLLDFGLAEALANASAGSQSQSVRGTPQYRCPYDVGDSLAANDLWSLAAVLFECVTGRRLFDVMLSRPPAQSIDVRLLRPDLSPELAGVVNQSLSPDPALRPQSADEFRLWLERARPV